MNKHNNTGIIGTGHYLPEKVIDNHYFVEQGLDTSDEWIQTRTGIKTRRIKSDAEFTSDLAAKAGQQAIQSANITPADIDLVIVATSTPDHNGFPSTACLVQEKLNIPHCPAFDVSAACTGFNYALTTAIQFIENNTAQTALVIGADALSEIVNWEDRGTCILFGDGAGAAILSKVETGGHIDAILKADGKEADILKVENNYIEMNGKAVFKTAISHILPTLETCLEKNNLKKEDIHHFIPHQANLRIINQVANKLNLNPDQVAINVDKYGNTSAASIPIALSEAHQNGHLKPNDLVVLAGFGAGFTWGVNLIHWSI